MFVCGRDLIVWFVYGLLLEISVTSKIILIIILWLDFINYYSQKIHISSLMFYDRIETNSVNKRHVFNYFYGWNYSNVKLKLNSCDSDETLRCFTSKIHSDTVNKVEIY